MIDPMGEIFKVAVKQEARLLNQRNNYGWTWRKRYLEYAFKNEYKLSRQRVRIGLYICGYVGCGESIPGRKQKAQLPKKIMHWEICKSFSKAGWIDACQKTVLGNESLREQKLCKESQKTKFISLNLTPKML